MNALQESISQEDDMRAMNSILNYETAIKTGQFLLIAHGTEEVVEKARRLSKQRERQNSQCISMNHYRIL